MHTQLHDQRVISAKDLLQNEQYPTIPAKRLYRKSVVNVGVKALARICRELLGLPANATCIPVKKRHEFFFACTTYDSSDYGSVPVSALAEQINQRLIAGARRFSAKVTKVEWKEVWLQTGFSRVQMTVHLAPEGTAC